MSELHFLTVREAQEALEYIDTVKLAVRGLANEATAISRARVALDKLTPPPAHRAECGGYYCDERVGHIDCEPEPIVCAFCCAVLDPAAPYIEAGYRNLAGVRAGLVLIHPFCNEKCVVGKYQSELAQANA